MTASGKTEPENKYSKPLRLVSTVILSMLVLFEGYKAVNMYFNWMEGSKAAPLIYSIVATIFALIVLIKTLLGDKKAIVLWYFLGVFNLVTTLTSLYQIEIHRIEIAFGMPLIYVYIYFGLQALLAIILGFYGWSLTRPTIAHEMRAKQKAKDFGEFLKNKA